jgi:hypothetical protein
MAKWKIIPQSQTFEKRVDRELCMLYADLAKTYDFSKATAKAMGAYRPLEPLSKNKESKSGGDMLSGRLSVQRYLAYNGVHGKIAITAELDLDQPMSAGRWVVSLPETQLHMTKGRTIRHHYGMTNVEFPDHEKELAWALYRELVAVNVPKHKG